MKKLTAIALCGALSGCASGDFLGVDYADLRKAAVEVGKAGYAAAAPVLREKITVLGAVVMDSALPEIIE